MSNYVSRQPTVFDQVYGTYQRPNFTNSYRWKSNDIHNRTLKTRTCFDTGHLREQYHQSKAVTPPSSDYTDAYLAAFAPKPVPTRRICRITAPVFANVVPLRTFSSMNNSNKTSETRFNSLQNSTYSSSFVPSISSRTQPIPSESSSIFTHSSSPSLSIYRPTVSFQSAPSKTPDRPQTLSLQSNDKSLADTTSKPIQILEQTIQKYDSVIEQISEILASVSPLSSTVDSMSPSKSALDYELTADGSPILYRKQLDTQQSPSMVKTSILQRAKGKHLIRDESYDKILTAIEDLDNQLARNVIEEDNEQFIQHSQPQDISKISQLVSLRRTIATSATPLIETIQSAVSNMRSVNASQPVDVS